MHPYLINHSDIREQRIKPLPNAFFRNVSDMTFREVAYVILDVLLGDEIEPDFIKKLVDQSLNDTIPFSPEAESAFVAALWTATETSAAHNTLLCAVEPEDYHLVNELSSRVNVNLIVPKGSISPVNNVRIIEVQGSPTDCVHLCTELEKITPVCTLHNAAAAAVRVAVAIYCATHPSKNEELAIQVDSAAMLRAYETAIQIGLKCATPTLLASSATNGSVHDILITHNEKHKSIRIAPTVEAVMRVIKSN